MLFLRWVGLSIRSRAGLLRSASADCRSSRYGSQKDTARWAITIREPASFMLQRFPDKPFREPAGGRPHCESSSYL
jgi:hypothetical protein